MRDRLGGLLALFLCRSSSPPRTSQFLSFRARFDLATRHFSFSSVLAAKKKNMPPKKAAAAEKKVLLGRPSNNLKIGIVGPSVRTVLAMSVSLMLESYRGA